MIKVKRSLLVVGFVLVSVALLAVATKPASVGASLVGFQAGNIIDDVTMSNKNSLSETQIQSFLKSKNSCNNTNLNQVIGGVKQLVNGTGQIVSGSYTWSVKDNHFVCMADEIFGANGLPAATGETAAHIIWQAAQDYSINPQVLIVLLQKEQSLITDTLPNSQQYKTATGYGCPDTAPCDSQYFGLKNQIRMAASLFRTVLNGGWSNYPAYQTVYVQYSPDTSCGGSNVYIQNYATSALYRYTPYQPNAAALAAGWGQASCGAYGNRNFYNYFTDWFGSTQGQPTSPGLVINNGQPTTLISGQKIPVQFTISNPTKNTVNFTTLGVAVRGPNDENLDASWKSNIQLKGGENYTYNASFQPTSEGDYKIFISYILASNPGVWQECAVGTPVSTCYNPVPVKKPVELTGGLILKDNDSKEIASFHQNQAINASFTVKNTSEKYSANIGKLVVAGRLSVNDQNVDMPTTSKEIALAPGETYTYNAQKSISVVSDIKFFISQNISGVWYEKAFYTPSSNKQEAAAKVVLPQTTLTKGVTLSSNHLGQQTLTMEITNFGTTPVTYPVIGIAARDPKGNNRDPKWMNNVTIAANSTFKYSAPINLGSTGKWIFFVSSQPTSGVWNESWPVAESSGLVRRTTVEIVQ